MRKGGGFGLVVLVIVMAVVLLLVAKSWKSVAPTATQLDPEGPAAPLETHGEDEAGEALQSGNLPDLNEMRSETDAHAERLEQALSEIE